MTISQLTSLGSVETLNDEVEEMILGDGPRPISDINYTPMGVDGDLVIFQVDCDVSEVLDTYDEEDEDQRRDEKHGLYTEHENPAN